MITMTEAIACPNMTLEEMILFYDPFQYGPAHYESKQEPLAVIGIILALDDES